MGFGILEDKHMEMPPGTAKLDIKFDKDHMVNLEDDLELKKHGDTILVPQPSNNPNDPLNWSPLWKNSTLVILAFMLAVTISQGPMITPGLPQLTKEYNKSKDEIASIMVGGHSFAAGATLFFVAAGASIIGKRVFYVVGSVLLLLTAIWGYFAKSWNSLAAMRIIQGFASGPVEALVMPSIADLFFVHQRGSRMALWHVMVGGGVGLGQIISGFIIQYLGLRATFGISAIWYAILLPLTFFFVLETSFVRPKSAYSPGKHLESSEKGISLEPMDSKMDSKGEVEQIELRRTHSQEPEVIPPKQTFKERLGLIQGRYSTEPFTKLLFKPLPLFFFPAILYSTVTNGFHMVGMMAMGLLGVDIFSAAPYNLKPSQLGMTHIPNLVISFIFAPLSGFLADWVAKFLARRNKGIFEPEFRLWLMLIAVPISTIAFVGYGWAVSEKKPLAVILAMSGLQAVSVPFASQAALMYVLDCHPRDSNPAFVTIHFSKTLFVFIATSKVRGWLDHSGPRNVFNILALVNLLVSSLTIPAYIYGKRFRSIVARSKLAQLVEAH